MQNTFEKLFQLEFKHHYFNSSNPANIIKLGPTILNGSPDIRLNETANGYFAFRPKAPKTADDSLKFLSLCFPISFTEPIFFNYTEINFSPSSVLYFSTDKATDGIIKSSDAINIVLRPSQFEYPMELETQQGLTFVSLTHPDGSIHNFPLPKAPFSNGYPINLNGEIAGKYEIQFKFKGEKETIIYTFFSSDHFYNSPPPAIFECKLTTDPAELDINIPVYTIAFESRSTYWQYVFPNIDKEEWDTLRIDSIEINNQIINFQKTKELVQLPNGQSAYAVISSKQIPLMERPPWKIKLTTKKNPNGIILPYAQPNNLTIKPSEDESNQKEPKSFISDIFVYV